MNNKKIQQWALTISSYNAKIEYIAGPENSCADLLSRSPGLNSKPVEAPDIHEYTFEVNAFNSNQFTPSAFTDCKIDPPDLPSQDQLVDRQEQIERELSPEATDELLSGDPCTTKLDMVTEQDNDSDIVDIKQSIRNGKMPSAIAKHHLIVENVLYYLSNPEDEPSLRLYIPVQLRDKVVKQFHDKNGHPGIDRTFQAIKLKYYWPNLYKQLHEYVTRCITCQTRSLRKQPPTLQETEIPPFAFAKVGMDLSGPYPLSLSGNRYIVSFVDILSGWPEAFVTKDKNAETIAHLVIEEIFPRYGCPLQIITDNGTGNENRVMRETLVTLNIDHVTTSFYHPQSNAKVERFHRTLHDVLSKKIETNTNTWDLYLNQTLGAIRFNINESAKFSPFFLLYGRDVVLPLDNLLQPRRKYMGDEPHFVALEQQHKSFIMAVYRNLKKAKRLQAKYANRGRKDVEFSVGDPVYYKNHQRKNKLQGLWKPYYRIIEKKGPVSFIIRSQLTGESTKCHAEHLRLAKIDEWEIPTEHTGRRLRQAAYAVPPESDTESDSSDSDTDPMNRIIERSRKERQDSLSEDDIPLMELSKRLKEREQNNTEPINPTESDTDGQNDEERDNDMDVDFDTEEQSSLTNKFNDEASPKENEMLVDSVSTKTINPPTEINSVNTNSSSAEVNSANKAESENNKSTAKQVNVKLLLTALAGLID